MPATFFQGIAGVALFEFLGQVAACFGDDFDAALDEPLLFPVGFEGFERHVAHDAPHPLDRFDNIGKAWCETFADR